MCGITGILCRFIPEYSSLTGNFSVTSHQRFRISKSNELTKAELVMDATVANDSLCGNTICLLVFFSAEEDVDCTTAEGVGWESGMVLWPRGSGALPHRIYSWIFFSKHYPDLNDMENPYRPACE